MSAQMRRLRSNISDRLSWLERVGRIEARRRAVDLDALRHRRDAERAARADADQGSYAEAARSALRFWQSARTVRTVHPSLSRKRRQPHAARRSGKALFLPIVDLDGGMHSLQVITPAGQQTLLAGGRIAGNLIPVANRMPGAARVLICEGFATGCTLAEIEPDATVLAAIDAGNLERVAVEARRPWPNAELVVCADADPVGLRKGRAPRHALRPQNTLFSEAADPTNTDIQETERR
jgi:putative DNA primase/helicase